MIMFGINTLIGGIIGVTGALALAILYNTLFENPSVRSAERLLVQAENEKFTTEAINEIAGNADKARAMLAYCKSIGKLYDFSKVECRDRPVSDDD